MEDARCPWERFCCYLNSIKFSCTVLSFCLLCCISMQNACCLLKTPLFQKMYQRIEFPGWTSGYNIAFSPRTWEFTLYFAGLTVRCKSENISWEFSPEYRGVCSARDRIVGSSLDVGDCRLALPGFLSQPISRWFLLNTCVSLAKEVLHSHTSCSEAGLNSSRLYYCKMMQGLAPNESLNLTKKSGDQCFLDLGATVFEYLHTYSFTNWLSSHWPKPLSCHSEPCFSQWFSPFTHHSALVVLS